MYSLKKNGGAKPLLAPGDVPLRDVDVRVKMLKELGVQNDYDPVITADIDGPNARAKRIDDRMARETPALASVRPATHIATAILLYSFGGLRRVGSGNNETLPSGVTENELLAACVSPDLDNITATAVLSELRNTCLYLHYDGVRYCFKKDPNVTKLIEDAEQTIAREDSQARGFGPVRSMIKEMLDTRLAGHHTTIVWPPKSQDIPDEDPRFLVAYLPLEFASESKTEQERQAREYLTKYGDRPRRFRNGLGLAIPEKKQIEALRRAVRYLLAIDRVENKKQQLRLTKDQLDQLKERKRTEQVAAESCFRELYTAVWLPRVQDGELEIEKVERGGRPLQSTGIHERIMELLTNVGTPRVHCTVTPRKITERVKLGESLSDGEPIIAGVKAFDILESFFRDINPPRLESSSVLRKGIARGVLEGVFAYVSGGIPILDKDGKFQVSRDKVILGKTLADDEIDFDSGFLMIPTAVPEEPVVQPPDSILIGEGTGTPPFGTGADAGTGTELSTTSTGVTGRKKRITLTFEATREQVFKVFPAIANLADKSDKAKVRIKVEGNAADGYDPSWLRNAVDEPLDEADIERISEE
jgi:hypothetical protein